jgi:serine/threonine-protein kinase
MASATTDHNLLFGILALQMDFITRDALVAAMNAWVLAKHRPLGDLLVEQGALAAARRDLLDGLVQEHLELHGNDAEKSLAALSSLASARASLEQIADADMHASLAHVSADRRPQEDSDATRLPMVGTPTSAGLRFRILRAHAQGGLGEVFVALDGELNREVALKEIQDRHADDPHSRARFLLEAEITGGLEHPGIVPVYGLGHYADGRPYYAMRFVRGDSLHDAIRTFHEADKAKRDPGERTLELRKLLGRFIDVCDAVSYAHSRGVLHRDLKPRNIMLGKYGETLVVDWGLARATGVAAAQESTADPTLRPSSGSDAAPTQAGAVIGTPAYMPPEQAAGRLELLGPASDVYSLGATLYCLLTGQAPFRYPDRAEVLRQVQRGEFPAPRRVSRTIPAALEAICLKAMALQPGDRYPSPRALAADVEKWLADEPVSAYREPLRIRAGRWARRHKQLVTGLAVLLLTALVLGSGIWLQRQRAELRQGVMTSLKIEKELLEQARWKDARNVLDEVEGRVGGWGLADLRQAVAQARADLDLARRLDDIRQKRATIVETPSAGSRFEFIPRRKSFQNYLLSALSRCV